MDAVEQFIDKLIQDKFANSPKLDEGVKNELKTDLIQRLMDRIDRAAIEALPEEKAVELSNKLDDPNFGPDQTTEFLKNSGVDLQQVALNTMLTFRKMYLGDEMYE